MTSSFPFRLSSVEEEGMMNCSKWLRHAVLLNLEEIKELLESLGDYFILPGSGILSEESWQISKEEIFRQYTLYLGSIKKNAGMPEPALKRFFTLMLSSSTDDFYAVKVGDNKYIVKACRPVIQVQLYHCFISRFDQQIHPMALSQDSFSFGLQFSFPQVYEDPKTHLFSKVLLEKEFVSGSLFKKLTSWFRKNTKPVPLQVKESKVYAPFRIGKRSEDKMHSHLGLQKALDYACT